MPIKEFEKSYFLHDEIIKDLEKNNKNLKGYIIEFNDVSQLLSYADMNILLKMKFKGSHLYGGSKK